jgi:hypothetical protein
MNLETATREELAAELERLYRLTMYHGNRETLADQSKSIAYQKQGDAVWTRLWQKIEEELTPRANV